MTSFPYVIRKGLQIRNTVAAASTLTWQTGGIWSFGLTSTITEAGVASFATSVVSPLHISTGAFELRTNTSVSAINVTTTGAVTLGPATGGVNITANGSLVSQETNGGRLLLLPGLTNALARLFVVENTGGTLNFYLNNGSTSVGSVTQPTTNTGGAWTFPNSIGSVRQTLALTASATQDYDFTSCLISQGKLNIVSIFAQLNGGNGSAAHCTFVSGANGTPAKTTDTIHSVGAITINSISYNSGYVRVNITCGSISATDANCTVQYIK